MPNVLAGLKLICTVVGALTLWALFTGVVVSWVLRRIKRGRAAANPAEPTGSPRPERRAQTWADVPSWVARDRQWAVAVVLLGSPDIAERTHPFVDFSRREIAWPALLAQAATWPRRERLLVYLASDLTGNQAASRTAEVSVADLVSDLDQYALDRVHTAVDLRRGRWSFDEAVERAGGLG